MQIHKDQLYAILKQELKKPQTKEEISMGRKERGLKQKMAIEELSLEGQAKELGSDKLEESDTDSEDDAQATGNVENVSDFAMMMDKYEEIVQKRKNVRLEELDQEFEVDMRLAQIPLNMAIAKIRQAILASGDAEQKSRLEKDLLLKTKKLEEAKQEIKTKHDAKIVIANSSCLTFDGEGCHCNYFYDPLTKKPTDEAERWEKNKNSCVKFYRGTSLKNQPLDQGPFFPQIHTKFEDVSNGVYDNRYPRDERVESFLSHYILHTQLPAAFIKTFVEYFRALPGIIQDVFPADGAMKIFQNTSCYPFYDTISNRKEHILHTLSRSVTNFFKTMNADLLEEFVTRLASDGVEAILEDNEVLQAAVTRIFPEDKYDFMRAKEGDYVLEGTLSFSHRGAMLFLGKTIRGQYKIIHAQNKKALLEKEAAIKAKADDKARLQARADSKRIQCTRCDGYGTAGVFLLQGWIYDHVYYIYHLQWR